MAATVQSLVFNLIFHPESNLHLLDEETILFLAQRSKKKAYSGYSVNVGEYHQDIAYFTPAEKRDTRYDIKI